MPRVCPVAGRTTVSRLSSSPHTAQYTTISQEPSVSHAAGFSFSYTTAEGVCSAVVVIVVRLSSSPHTAQYTTVSYEPFASHVAGFSFSRTSAAGVCPAAGRARVPPLPRTSQL